MKNTSEKSETGVNLHKIAGGVITYQQIPLKRFARLNEETRKAYVRRTLRDKRAAELSLFVLSAALTRSRSTLITEFLEEAVERDRADIRQRVQHQKRLPFGQLGWAHGRSGFTPRQKLCPFEIAG